MFPFQGGYEREFDGIRVCGVYLTEGGALCANLQDGGVIK